VLATAGLVLAGNPRVRLLWAVRHFSEQTLENPEYLLYDVDIMELFQDYANGDIAVDGRLNLSKLKDLRLSMYSNVSLTRSFAQKAMAADCGVEALFTSVGDIELYAKEQTLYMVVPMLDNLAYAFPTNLDLFMKMPDLTSDIDQAWFRDNYKNILELVRQITIEETGDTIEDEDGTVSSEYRITIPQGCGGFIWELFGMDEPDYDVVASAYLTPQNHLRRMVVDLEESLPGAVVTLDGENAGTGIFAYELPDDEQVEFTVVRSSEHTSWVDLEGVYYTNSGAEYVFTAALTWEEKDTGFDIRLRDILVKCGSDTWARGSFRGTVTPLEQAPDVLASAAVDLDSLEPVDWQELRDNADGFVDEVLAQIEERTGISLIR
jgi:hypothetical protein